MKVKKCPKKCQFDWIKFHGDLDIATAHMIEEIDGFLPSKRTLLELMDYSYEKRKLSKPIDTE